MTSLAGQLNALGRDAVVSNVNFQKRRKTASLLFDPVQAADLDLDQVFAIALNGYQELTSICPEVRNSSGSLFSDISRAHDRISQTAEDSRRLDRKIEKYLRIVSPIITIRPVLKTLEWLVRRFEIHRHNAQALLLSILPHRETLTFSRILTIIELPPRWSFLARFSKSSAAPDLAALAAAFSKDSTLVSLLLERSAIAAREGHGFQALYSLLTDSWAQTIGHLRQNDVEEEEITQQFLPMLTTALADSTTAELQASLLTVLAVMTSSCQLSSSSVNALSELIGTHMGEENCSASVLCLMQLLQSSTNYERLSSGLLRTCVAQQAVVSRINLLASRFRSDRLVVALALTAIAIDMSLYKDLLLLTWKLPDLTPPGRNAFVGAICSQVLRSSQNSETREAARWLFLQILTDSDGALRLRESLSDAALSTQALEQALGLRVASPEMPSMIGESPTTSRTDTINASRVLDMKLDENYLSVPDVRAIVDVLVPVRTEVDWKAALPPDASLQSKISIAARVALAAPDLALREVAFKQLIHECSNLQNFDLQVFLPFTIALLGSREKSLRLLALDFARVIQKSVQPSAGERSIYGMDGFYGEAATQQLSWLGSNDASALISGSMLTRASECGLDHKEIYRSVAAEMTTHGTKGKLLAHRSAVFHFLGSHLSACPVAKIQLKLLLCMSRIHSPTPLRNQVVMPLLSSWMSNFSEAAAHCKAELIEPDILFDRIVSQIVVDDQGTLPGTLVAAMRHELEPVVSVAMAHSCRLYSALRRDSKLELVTMLLNFILDEHFTFTREALRSYFALRPEEDVFAALIRTIRLSNSGNAESPSNKRHKTESQARGRALTVRRMTLVFELLEKSGSTGFTSLLPLCLAKLQETICLEVELHTAMSYTQQIILTCIGDLLTTPNLDPSAVRLDVIVNCIRNSASPQVQTRALLLVAQLAKIAPDQVLHGVMPIFTFMSANILRQDDGFSAHVIEETVVNVIPPLLSAQRSDRDAQLLDATDILRCFVDALPHVPKHRRLKLYIDLVNVMNNHSYLATLILLIMDKTTHIASSKDKQQEALRTYQEFVLALLPQFSPQVQLEVIAAIVSAIAPQRSPESRADESSNNIARQSMIAVLSMIDASDRMRLILLTTVAGHFASRKVRNILENAFATMPHLVSTATTVVIALLDISDTASEQKADVHDWQAKALDALDRFVTLLPVREFSKVAGSVATSARHESVRLKALQIVQTRAAAINPADSEASSSMLGLVRLFLTRLRDPVSSAVIRSSYLQSISAIGRRVGKSDLEVFANAAVIVLDSGAMESEDLVLKVSAIECVTTFLVVLGTRFLPILPRVVPHLLGALHGADLRADGDLIPLASISCLESAIKTIPGFMTSYMDTILRQAAAQHEASEELVAEKQRLLRIIPQHFPLRTVLPALKNAWQRHVGTDQGALSALLAVLRSAFEFADRAAISRAIKEAVGTFLCIFDTRRQLYAKSSVKTIERLERQAVDVFLHVALKLNDSTFRPVFYRLHAWTREVSATTDRLAQDARAITFYNLFSQLIAKFKSIVLDYFNGAVFDDCVGILSTTTGTNHCRLWTAVLQSLLHGFSTDDEDFWRMPGRFDKLVPLLVAQLEFAGPRSSYRLDETLIPAIVALTKVCVSDDNIKLVNAKVLGYFRHERAYVRLFAIRTAEQLCAQIGDEWLAMLPQTIPFLAEAMDDEDEKVSRAANTLALTIEKHFGEPLDKYL
ncbi:snoRNA-binding rRNA-processing protein utp10 [Savitreella phatthalungensis]